MNTTNAGAVALSSWLSARGITASEFARNNNLSPPSVLAWARGDYLPRIDKARDVERATNGAVALSMWTRAVED